MKFCTQNKQNIQNYTKYALITLFHAIVVGIKVAKRVWYRRMKYILSKSVKKEE